MPLARIWRTLLAIVFAVAMGAGAWAQSVLPVPALTARVIDQTGTLDGCPDVVLFPDVTKIKLQGKTVKRLQTLSGLEKNPNGFTGITAGKSVYQDIADMPGSAGHQNQGHRLLTRPRSGIRAKD